MNKITRRQFVGAGIATLVPRIASGSVASNPDVVVIGAGAAGLAATRTLLDRGRSVVLVEASDRIGGRAFTDTSIFGVPYDVGAHWLHNGKQNPYNEFAASNGYEIYIAPENYRLFSKSGKDVTKDQLDALFAENRNVVRAIGKAGRARQDHSAGEVSQHVDGRWSNTAKFMIGAWSMGKDLNEFSTQDWWNSEDGLDYYCSDGFGTLVAHYGRGIDVLLNTPVYRIDWQGTKLAVETERGTLKPSIVIVTVSTGVLSSDQIKFSPSLPLDKRESFDAISMGTYEHIALQFSKDVFELGADGYLLFEIGEDGNGFGTLTNASGSGIAYCDVGGSWAQELQQESEAFKIDYALNQITSLLGSDVKRYFIKGSATAWGLNPNYRGAYASARPGGYKMRRILRQPVADKIFFAGEACHSSLWATVGGAHLSGVKTAQSVLRMLA